MPTSPQNSHPLQPARPGAMAFAATSAPGVAPVAVGPRDTLSAAAPRARKTICELFQESVARYPERPALMHKESGRFRSRTYRQLADHVRDCARGLASLDVASGDRVAILCGNRPEWVIADLATLSLGAATTPLYPTLTAPQVRHILADSAAKVVVVEDVKQWRKVEEVRASLPDLRQVIMVETRPAEAASEGVLAFLDVAALGQASAMSEAEYGRRWQGVQPDDLASIIYTSGTTGEPKGAMLTHDNFTSNAYGVSERVDIRSEDLFLSFLPLSHVFERLGGYYFPLSHGCAIAYAESVFTVQNNMVEVRPTVMTSVPRLYESMQGRILDSVAKLPPVRRRLFHWAVGVGRAVGVRRREGRSVGPLLALQHALADRLVLAKVRERTGGRIRYFVSGGAPLPRSVAEFFEALGLTILEGYGLTETSPVISVNPTTGVRLGTVGQVIPGVEVRIASDGEILTRGPHVMRGYYNKPEATREAIDAEGWFHTGDIGELSADGYLRITDRKKDILVLANGKNVAPQPIEAVLKSSPYIEEVVLVGDRQPAVTALIVPAFDRLRAFARERGLPDAPEALAQHAEVRKLIKGEIDRLSANLADFERVKRFTLLERSFSVDEGELTPTLKVKRRVVIEKHADAIAKMSRIAESG